MLQAVRNLLIGAATLVIISVGAVNDAQAQQTSQLNICHAGSVSSAFTQVKNEFESQNPGVVIKDTSGGSLDLVRQLANGIQECDLYATADYTNIDLLLKPAGLADYNIIFAEGRMVLGYLASNPNTRGIARPGDFNPPGTIPEAVSNWYEIILRSGVKVGGSHPFLDPGAYRSHLIFQLAQSYYKVPNLYNDLLKHYTTFSLTQAASKTNASSNQSALSSDFQFSYEHSAQATAKKNPDYRYVYLPDDVDLSNSKKNSDYSGATIVVPGLGLPGTPLSATIPGTRVAWGVTLFNRARNRENAIKFLQLLLGSTGKSALGLYGPSPVSPASVSPADYQKIPDPLKALVTATKLSR
jgi:tungstate ABC transporter binding protein WtpA